jgi:deazaflavin-dependent oxidoreductase (nitroreductase family)
VPQVAQALRQPVTSADVLSVDVGDTESVAMSPNSGETADVMIRTGYELGMTRAMRPGRPRATKRAVARFVTNRLLNPIARRLLERGLWPRTQALLETRGRKTGLPRRVPVGNGLRGDDFWIVTEHGYAADYVKNIQADPHVRVKVGRHWYEGTAQILPDDDPRERLRWLRRPVNDSLLLVVGTQQLTIRVDLRR